MNDHSTSAAKSIDPLPEDFFNSPDLDASYQEALEAVEPIETREDPEPEGPRNREGLEGTSLETAPDAGAAFDGAAEEQAEPVNDNNEVEQVQDGTEGSKMVQDESLDPFPSPPDPIKTEAHREPFDERWNNEIERADQDNDQDFDLDAAVDAADQHLQQYDQGGMSQDMDRGM